MTQDEETGESVWEQVQRFVMEEPADEGGDVTWTKVDINAPVEPVIQLSEAQLQFNECDSGI